MSTKRIEIATTLNIGGAVKSGLFKGFAYFESGFLSGGFESSSGFSHAEGTLLSAFTLTGCPIAARRLSSQGNPWESTGGEYHGERYLEGQGFTAKSALEAKRLDDKIQMTLIVKVEGILPALQSIPTPFQEIIVQKRPGNLKGNFNLEFAVENGTRIKANVDTEYTLPTTKSYVDSWRNITIRGVSNAEGFYQIEQIDMYDNQIQANNALKSQIVVTA
jgi:hypothetical protein